MRTRWIGVVMLMALLIGACSMPGIEADLDGTWILLRGVDDGAPITPIPEAPVTISMSDGRVGGTAACNGYQGTIDRSGTSIAIGGLTKTAIGCEPPIAALEEAYLAALPRATEAVRVGDSLTLSGPGVELEFALDPPIADAGLVGPEWTLETLISGEAAASVAGEATLVLRDDGTLSGSTGCRSFSGPYTVEGDRLNVGDLVVDLRACDEGLGAQDAAVLAIVGADPDLAIAGDTLSLRAADGGLDYRAEP